MGLTQVNTDGVKDDAVTLAKQAAGTDGQIITYDASGNPVAVGPGTDGQVLTSTGAGSPPAFEDAVSEGTQIKSTGESGGTKFLREDGDGTCSWQTLPASGASLSGSTDNTVVTVTGANAMQGETKLTFDGNTLDIDNGGSPGVLRIGGNVNSSGRTDDTYKLARVVTPHYHNAEEPMAIFQTASDGTNNNISYGGSWGDANAATQHRFYTAANDATTTGTERFNIDKDGYVTKPDTPAFHYYAPSNTSSNARMTGNNEDLVFANAALNVGSHYSNSNGRFTAPVAGRYLFVFNGLIDNDASGAHRNCVLFKNGSWAGVTFCYDYNGGDSNYHGMSGSGIISMAANDYVTFRATEGWHCSNETNGGGYLLG